MVELGRGVEREQPHAGGGAEVPGLGPAVARPPLLAPAQQVAAALEVVVAAAGRGDGLDPQPPEAEVGRRLRDRCRGCLGIRA